jgi:aldehyde:ferredoxin oxidoreductase
MSSATSNYESGFEDPDMGYPESPERFEVEGKAEFVMKYQNFHGMFDSLPCCKFMAHNGVPLKPTVKILELITGFGIDEKEFLKIGDRIFNLKRIYNVKCGITRKDDTLPNRFLHMTIEGEEKLHKAPPLENMLEQFYALRGWDQEGKPTTEIIRKFGLEEYL